MNRVMTQIKTSDEVLEVLGWVHEMILINKSYQNDSLSPEYDYEQNINRLLNQCEDSMTEYGLTNELLEAWFDEKD